MVQMKRLILAGIMALLCVLTEFTCAQDTTADPTTPMTTMMTGPTTTPGSTTTGKTTKGTPTSSCDKSTTKGPFKPWDFFRPDLGSKPKIEWVPLGYLLYNKLSNKFNRRTTTSTSSPSHG